METGRREGQPRPEQGIPSLPWPSLPSSQSAQGYPLPSTPSSPLLPVTRTDVPLHLSLPCPLPSPPPPGPVWLCGAGGMPLVFTQEDFLVLKIISTRYLMQLKKDICPWHVYFHTLNEGSFYSFKKKRCRIHNKHQFLKCCSVTFNVFTRRVYCKSAVPKLSSIFAYMDRARFWCTVTHWGKFASTAGVMRSADTSEFHDTRKKVNFLGRLHWETLKRTTWPAGVIKH